MKNVDTVMEDIETFIKIKNKRCLSVQKIIIQDCKI